MAAGHLFDGLDFAYTSTLQTATPRIIAYTILCTAVACFLHLVGPALSASLSPKYEPFPWVKGERGLKQFFSITYDCVFNSGSLFKTAYAKVRSTTKQLFLIPFPHSNTGFMLLLPQDLIAEYAKQPESTVSFFTYVRGVMNPKYTLFGENILNNNLQHPIVYRELFQKLSNKIDMMNDEMVQALDVILKDNLDSEGKIELNMWDTATQFLSRTSNRIIVGQPLCRNQEFLDHTVHYAVNIFSLALYMRFIPPFLRPLFAPLMQRPLARDRDIVAKHALPVVKERMKTFEAAVAKGEEPELPNDLLSTTIRVAYEDPDKKIEYEPLMLVHRLLALNFLQSYTNTLTLTNAVYDLISLPKDIFQETIVTMRTEITAKLEETGGKWDWDFVNKLDFMDSFIRESMRANIVGEVGLERTIMTKEGFTFSNGLHVPYGTTLCAPTKSIQQDPLNYPGGFDPWRSLKDPEKPKITTVGPTFLNFGLGRPACPGRWFSASLLKLALSHLVMDYDFDRLDVRPPGVRKITLEEPCGRHNIVLRRRAPM